MRQLRAAALFAACRGRREAKIGNLLAARGTVTNAQAEVDVAAATQRINYNNLGSFVQTSANGEETFITSSGYGVRIGGSPRPPEEDAPGDLRIRVNGVAGAINFSWGNGLPCPCSTPVQQMAP